MLEPILIEFPSIITTDNLIIRSPRPGDGKAAHQAVSESQDYLKDWMPWAVEVPDAEWYEKWARENHLDFLGRKNLTMMVIHQESGKFIGGTGFHSLDWSIPSLEIGYWLHPSYSGRGYMTEAVKALTEFGFNTLKAMRIEIRCDADNLRSVGVAERAGYQLEATFKNHRRHHITNKLTTTLVYAKIAEEHHDA
ncbi:MAG: GNAT family N-acetyltransferase [Chloroflexota bacterium]